VVINFADSFATNSAFGDLLKSLGLDGLGKEGRSEVEGDFRVQGHIGTIF
jgi:hypothetical protein